jgi:putative spermidine/putrescine transport system ATP-binding protein
MATSAEMTAAPKTAKLVIEGLCKRYGATTALEPSSLGVAEGEFLTLLGPSGSGKTTLLQLICGLVEASEGRVVIDGRDQSNTPVHRRDIGLVFQHYALFPHLTVAENIAFPLRMRGRPGAEVAKRVAAALEMVHLGHLSGRFPRELSGGQQQRVALARCFVYQPSIILMDEPLGALDKKLREHMQIEIKRLHRESGATIVYVTHDQEEALAMSDRICLMNHARIEQLGTPREIYERPRTAFAADFIGISNIFRGRWDGNGAIDTAHGRFALPSGARSESKEAVLVIRPENLRLGARDGNAVSGRVCEVVYAGSETRVIAALDDGGQLVLRLGPDDAVPAIDEAIIAGWSRDKAVLVA